MSMYRCLPAIAVLGAAAAGCRAGTESAPVEPSPPPAAPAAYFAAQFHTLPGLLAPAAVTLTYDDGAGPRTLPGAALRTTPDWGTPFSDSLPIRNAGVLRVRVMLTQGDTLGVGDVRIEALPGAVHWATVQVTPENPVRSVCIACVETRAFPLRRPLVHAPSGVRVDSFSVTWGRRPDGSLRSTWPRAHHSGRPRSRWLVRHRTTPMTDRAFFRTALLAPLVVPPLTLAAAWAAPRAFAGPALVLGASLALAGAPYALFATAAWWWSRPQPTERLVRFALRAPLLFAPLAAVGVTAFYASGDGPWRPGWLLANALGGAGLAIAVGYVYVGALLVVDMLRRHPGTVTAPSPGAT